MNDVQSIEQEEIGREFLARLTSDLRTAAERLTTTQARYLVDTYYQVQQFRIEAANQARAGAQMAEPSVFVAWIARHVIRRVGTIRGALDVWSSQHRPGRWAKSQVGIGPVIAAGLLAHIDITRAPTAGAIWRFAGLDPTHEWLGTERAGVLVAELWEECDGDVEQVLQHAVTRLGRREETVRRHALIKTKKLTKASLTKALARQPWNAKLKVLCWKMAESFVKTSGHEESFYGRLWAERKIKEVEANEAGRFGEQAELALKRKRYGADTIARKWYEQGKLPPAHIHARSERWIAKLFLAHYQHVAYESHYGTLPPKPYVISILGHAHEIRVPGWPIA